MAFYFIDEYSFSGSFYTIKCSNSLLRNISCVHCFVQLQIISKVNISKFTVCENKCVHCLYLCQCSVRKTLNSLKEDKTRADKQHHSEIAALSSNLTSLRQQLETTNGNLKAAETNGRQQTSQLAGVCVGG